MKQHKETARWILWAVAFALIALLGSTIETGRVNALTSSAFTFLGSLSNVVTPNNDGLNDFAIFCFDNPRASDVSGSIFDLRGGRVASMVHVFSGANCPGQPPGTPPTATTEKLTWDGRAGGQPVASGIYVYQIQAEGTTITGTVMVAR